MKNKLLLMCLFSGFVYSSEQNATVRIGKDNQTSIGGILAYCECGKNPVMVMFLYGKMQLYCAEHMPEIERVRRVTPENLSEILRREQ
jgi:hypothetical protein